MTREKKLAFIKSIFYKNCDEDYWFRRLEQYLKATDLALEIGGGSGKGYQNKYYPQVNQIVGIDLDERVQNNQFLNEAHVGSAYELEQVFRDKKFNAIYSHMVAEHIEDADQFVEQQLTCLAEDGVIFHSTVSKYYWTSLINNLVPERVKNFLIAKLGSGRPSEDIFPAHYQLNSKWQIARLAKKYNLEYQVYRQDQAPGYLRRSIVLMLIYSIIHRPLQFIFPSLRPTFCFLMKKKAH